MSKSATITQLRILFRRLVILRPFFPPAISIAITGFGLCLSSVCAQPGATIWTNRYDGFGSGADQGNALAVDKSGNVFVAGSSQNSGGDYDYVTIAYSEAGLPLWTNRYDGLGNGYDSAVAVALDSSGKVFVTGRSIGVDRSFDYLTISYSNEGVPLWTNRYIGPWTSRDIAESLAVDSSGNVIVTGHSDPGGDDEYLTISYSNSGMPLWTNRYNGSSYASDQAKAIAVNGDGNVFVTGYSQNSGGNYDYDYATVAYSEAGLPLWTNRYDGPGNGDDFAYAVAVNGNGNLSVTGASLGDYATIAYSSAGVPLWTNRYNGLGNGYDEARSIAASDGGNVCVTGYSLGSGTDNDYTTIAYSHTGVALWTNRYNGPGNGGDYANAVAVDSNGNVFVGGSSYGIGSVDDCATIAYSSSGVPLWTNRYNGANNYDEIKALVVDGNGNLVVTGNSWGSGVSYWDYATIKYSGAGISPIRLNFQTTSNQLVLSWANSAFRLQAAPEVGGIYTNIPTATSPYTNVILGQQYFRLKGY